VILVPLSFMALGQGGLIEGVKQFVSSPPTQDYYHLFKPSQGFTFTLAWICLFLLSFPGSDSVGQRLYSVPDEKAARKTILLSALLYAIAPVIWVFPIFVMRPLLANMKELWPQLNNPNEASYVTITLMLLPNGMIGLVVSGILAATMSTISAIYNVISSIFIRDVYKPFFAPEAESRKLMAAGKVFTFVFGIITIWIGLLLANFGKIDAFTLTYTISTHAGFVFSAPIIAGLLFRRIPWWTPFVSIAACISTTMSLEFLFGGYLAREYPQGIFGDIKAHLYECKIFGAIAVNIIIFLISSRFYNDKDPRNQKADKLFSLLKKPISEDADAALFVPNLKTYRIVGWILAFYGVFMIALSMTGATNDPRRINLVAGLIFMGLYGMIQWWTSPRFSPFPLVRKQLQKDIR
jgi:SSS family solute:Na+ symporter